MFEENESKRIALAMKEFEKELEHETEQEKLKAEKTLNTLAKRKEKLLMVSLKLFSDFAELKHSVRLLYFLDNNISSFMNLKKLFQRLNKKFFMTSYILYIILLKFLFFIFI